MNILKKFLQVSAVIVLLAVATFAVLLTSVAFLAFR